MYSPVRDKYPNGTELSIAELLRYTICESDGSASDVLMKLIGGPGKVMLFLEEIHVPDIQVVNYEKEIGRDWETQYRNWATPNGVVAHKTGTGGTRNGIASAINDIGIITLPDGRDLAVAGFVSESAANDDTRDAIIARLAKAAWDSAHSLGR